MVRALLVGVAALAFGCGAGGPERPPGQADAGAPNVFLLTLDTLRADRLSCYGYGGETSPFLDSLAARGVLFDRAYSASNITKPSHATLLTGLFPKSHGLLTNHDDRLSEEAETLAEVFREAGYQTLAAVGAGLLDGERTGFGQGFAHYLDCGDAERPAEAVAEAVLERLGGLDAGPVFGWFHFFDPHTPYRPPAAFVRPPAPDPHERPVPIGPFGGESMERGTIPASSALPGTLLPSVYSAAYDGEIRYLDRTLERLFATLEAAGLLDGAVIAVTADHGELLGEHGIYYRHSGLYEEVVRVPLIVVGPGVEPGRYGGVVGTVDLAATLLDLAGLPGRLASDGESLVARLERGPSPEDAAFYQHAHDVLIGLRTLDETLWLPRSGGPESVITAFNRFSRRAYLRYIGGESPRYFRTGEDPEAATGRSDGASAAASAERVAELERRLRRWYGDRPRRLPIERSPLTPDEVRQLEALGYL